MIVDIEQNIARILYDIPSRKPLLLSEIETLAREYDAADVHIGIVSKESGLSFWCSGIV